MINLLGMELHSVRTVFYNAINEVSVYADKSLPDAPFYTVITIFSNQVSKYLAEEMAINGMFENNRDFKGSFSHKGNLHLIFNYYGENRLIGKEALYGGSFLSRKETALSFLTAMAESEIEGSVGSLLIQDQNINLSQDGKIYFNYFFDFTPLLNTFTSNTLYFDVTNYVFNMLTADYDKKYNRNIANYPDELQLMFKKAQNNAFTSYSALIAFVKYIPDAPSTKRVGIKRIFNLFTKVKHLLVNKPMNVFLCVIVAVTMIYLGYQLSLRFFADRKIQEATVFVGLEQIGEMFLGEVNL